MTKPVRYDLRQVGDEWVMFREGGGEAFREPSKEKAISRAYEVVHGFQYACVVATHHENGIVELKNFGVGV